MSDMSLDSIKNKIMPVLLANGVTFASIFGSTARGENRPDSDIDILLDVRNDMSLIDLAGLKIELEDILGRSVDLVERSSLREELRGNILRDQVVVL